MVGASRYDHHKCVGFLDNNHMWYAGDKDVPGTTVADAALDYLRRRTGHDFGDVRVHETLLSCMTSDPAEREAAIAQWRAYLEEREAAQSVQGVGG